MFRRKLFKIFIVLFLLICIGGCGQTTRNNLQNPTDAKFELRWGTIQAGGAWQVIGNAMLEDIKKACPDITGSCLPGASAVNVLGIHEGKFNIAFANSDSSLDAWLGEGVFIEKGKMQSFRLIQTNLPFVTHIVVRKDSGIDKIEDLRGRRISPGPKGVSSDIQFQRLLGLYGMTYNDVKVQFLAINDAAQQFIDGQLDCLALLTVPPPYAPVINVSSQRNIKLLSIPDDKIDELCKFPGVGSYVLEGGLYRGVDYPVKGIVVRSHIIVHKDVPAEIVYKITKTLTENHERYKNILASWKFVNSEDMTIDFGIPYHPGALQYYKEKGIVK